MASIQKRDNGKWRARYRDAAGREHARHFARKVDAQRWLDEVTASVVTGQYVDPRAGKVTVAAYAASWEQLQVSSDSTRSIIDNALRLHLLPELGGLPMAAVRVSTIQSVVKKLEAKGLSAGSIRVIYRVAAMLFNAAVDDKIIPATPCRKVKLPKGDSREVVPPTVEDVDRVVQAVEARWRAVVVTLAGSGLRIGELLGLEVADVDFLRRTIRVERQRNQTGTLSRPKSESSRRTVPVGQVVVDTLAAHLAAYPSEGALFVDEIGEPLLYRRWRTIWEAAAASAGIERELLGLAGGSAGITVTDEDYAGTTITTINLGNLKGVESFAAPIPADLSISYAATDEVVVIGVGTDFTKAVLDARTGPSLAQTERFSAALAQAGTAHSALFWVDVVGVRGLAEAQLSAEDKAEYEADVKPYLDAFDSVIGTFAPGTDLDRGTVIIRVAGD